MPASYNYVGVFLTLRCTYACSYCINRFQKEQFSARDASGKDWVIALNRIVPRADLPVTLQGGEPTFHRDFYYIINNLKPELKIDLLTNISFDVEEFISKVSPGRVKREAPYASIRVSFHPGVMDLDETIDKVQRMRAAGFYIGVWTVSHPRHQDIIRAAKEKCSKLNIDFRTKEFLGFYEGNLYGQYLYKDACLMEKRSSVLCKTTEFLIAPDLQIYRCHNDLYAGINSIGHFLDPSFELKDEFKTCDNYGFCNPCDVKLKTDRFQQFGHTSVEIKSMDTLYEAKKTIS